MSEIIKSGKVTCPECKSENVKNHIHLEGIFDAFINICQLGANNSKKCYDCGCIFK